MMNPLKIESQEQKQILLMLATGFFMGFFIATYQVTADSLFLNRLGHQLNKAFLVAGALGIFTTSAFSYFQTKIKFTTLILVSVVLIFMFSLGAFMLLTYGHPSFHTNYIFALYCMSGPITAILLLSFWGLFGRLFNFRQSKRIIGWIDAGQLIASTVATLIVIPFSAKFIHATSQYLLICSASIFIVSILLITISSSFNLSKNDPKEFGILVRHKTSITKLFSDRYILLLSLFLFISMVIFMLNQYAFQQLVQEQYPDERELTTFTSFFIGAIYGLSLIMQTFINNKIISNYGLRVSLFILPVLIGLLALSSIVMGSVFGFDKESSPVGFVYFFLFIALCRLFNWTLRDSLENPVFKLFFIPLESSLRFNIQSKVEGLVNEGARFIAGILIFVLAFIPFFQVAHISVFVIILVFAYTFVIDKLYNGYRNKIKQKLEGTSEVKQEKLDNGLGQLISRLEQMLLTLKSSVAVFSFKLLEKLNVNNLSVCANILAKNENDAVRYYACQRVNELKTLSSADQYIAAFLSRKKDFEFDTEKGSGITTSSFQRLARSADANDRLFAAELLLHTSKEEEVILLSELLTDPDPQVRNAAIKTSSKRYNPEIINLLIETFGNPAYSNQAMNALVSIGKKALQVLDAAFYRTGQNTQTMLKIVQAMGRIGGKRAKELLWNKIDYPNDIVVSQVLLSLGECGFKAGVSQVTRINYAIEEDIANIRWNLSSIYELDDDGFSNEIKIALRGEIQNDIAHIYMLLAMLYDTRSIQLVKENIDSGTADGITYAIELLDVFLSEQLKQYVIPVLDDLTDAERINKLDYYFPRVKLDSRLTLKFILNRDFTQANRWTKACVLYHIGMQRMEDFKLDLIAQLFNPDIFIKEVAAWALFQINQVEYHKHTKRLGDAQKKELDDLSLGPNKKMSHFERVLFLKKTAIFENVPGLILTYLADISENCQLQKNGTISEEDINHNFYILVKGIMHYYLQAEVRAKFSPGQFIGEMLPIPTFGKLSSLKAKTNIVALRFSKEKFYELLADNIKLADSVIGFTTH